MTVLIKKELSRFFSNASGYFSLILFFIISGLFLFILPEYNLFDAGYAGMQIFFEVVPWFFLFLLPAITMRSFTEEWQTGTMELLLTSPLSKGKLVFGKYIFTLLLLLLVLALTGIYYITIRSLALSPGEIDRGALFGAYLGLFLLGAVFSAIGIWASSLTQNTVLAFLLSVFCCFLFYYGFEALGGLSNFRGNADYYLEHLGISFHYQSLSRGVIEGSDLLYFFSLIFLFLMATKWTIGRHA